jgi:hypothetical protein
MQYLENTVCKMIPLFEINYKIKKKLICASFFKMKTSGYKDFSIYVNGVKNVSKNINNIYPDWVFRIFIDNHIYNDAEIMNVLWTLKNTELVLFTCPSYCGLFATLVRFFPMFDFPNNDASYVAITDIDSFDIDYNKYIMKNINKYNNNYFIKLGNVFYKKIKNYNLYYNNKFKTYSYAFNIISIKRLPNNILINFINMVNQTKNVYSCYYDANNNDSNKFNIGSNFCYGVDEYFINNVLCEYLLDNKIPYIEKYDFDLVKLLYNTYVNYNELSTNEQYVFEKLIDKLLKMSDIKVSPNLNLNDKYLKIDKIIFTFNETSKLKYSILKNLYICFLVLHDDSEYSFIFKEDVYKYILFNFGSYKATALITNNKHNYLINDKFHKNDIEIFKKLIDPIHS